MISPVSPVIPIPYQLPKRQNNDKLTSRNVPEEAKLAWEEYCYHNALCDIVAMMLRHGEVKVLKDIIDMYDSAEAVKNV